MSKCKLLQPCGASLFSIDFLIPLAAKIPEMLIRKEISLLVLLLVFFAACNSGSPRNKSPEQLRMELLVREQAEPLSYLNHSGTWRKNILGDMVLEGDISNSATIAKFKDAQLKVTWLSKTDSPISTSYYTVYEYFSPGQSTHYKLKVDAPSGTAGVRTSINSAVAVK